MASKIQTRRVMKFSRRKPPPSVNVLGAEDHLNTADQAGNKPSDNSCEAGSVPSFFGLGQFRPGVRRGFLAGTSLFSLHFAVAFGEISMPSKVESNFLCLQLALRAEVDCRSHGQLFAPRDGVAVNLPLDFEPIFAIVDLVAFERGAATLSNV